MGHNKGSPERKVYSHELHILKGKKEYQINDLILQLKLIEKQEQTNPKTSRRKEIIKIRAKKIQKKSMKQKAGSLIKINKIDRPLANLTKTRKEKSQISKIRNAEGERTTNNMEVQEIIRDYFESLHSNKFENLKLRNRF
jgi:hypothetical protein